MPMQAYALEAVRSRSRTTIPSMLCWANTRLSGTYAFDAATHVVTLRFAQGKIALGTLEGHAYIDGKELLLVFPVTKFVKMATALGSKISSLSTVTALLEKYKTSIIGFAFQK